MKSKKGIILFKYIVFLGVSCFQLSSYGADLDEYMATINSRCPGVNRLVVKKSLIELTAEQDCDAPFTALLLKSCPQLTCSTLLDYWSSFNTSKSGAIIGK